MNQEYYSKLQTKLIDERTSLRDYIQKKLDNDEDYHAIIDAAMDIRDIDAKLVIIDTILK